MIMEDEDSFDIYISTLIEGDDYWDSQSGASQACWSYAGNTDFRIASREDFDFYNLLGFRADV